MSVRYRIIAPALRHTLDYQQLSRPAPNARTLLEWLMTGDCSGMIPGLLVAGWRSLMEQLGWDHHPDALQRAVWDELLASGLVRHDPKTRLVWLPFMVADVYLPDQPQIIRSWAGPWGELPDCDLKHDAWVALRQALASRAHRRRDARGGDGQADNKTAFGPIFETCCPEPKRILQGHCYPAHQGNNQGNSDPANHRQEGSLLPSHARSQPGSLQDQDPEEDKDQDPEKAVHEAPPARDPGPPAPAQQPLPIPPARLALPPPSPPPQPVKSRFDCPEYKPLILDAVADLIAGSEGRVLAPMVRGKPEVDANTIQRLFGLFVQFDPTAQQLTEIGRIWASDEFWKARDREGKQRLCSVQLLAADQAMFAELLGIAQHNLSGAPPLETKPPPGKGRARGSPRAVIASAETQRTLEAMSGHGDSEAS